MAPTSACTKSNYPYCRALQAASWTSAQERAVTQLLSGHIPENFPLEFREFQDIPAFDAQAFVGPGHVAPDDDQARVRVADRVAREDEEPQLVGRDVDSRGRGGSGYPRVWTWSSTAG